MTTCSLLDNKHAKGQQVLLQAPGYPELPSAASGAAVQVNRLNGNGVNTVRHLVQGHFLNSGSRTLHHMHSQHAWS